MPPPKFGGFRHGLLGPKETQRKPSAACGRTARDPKQKPYLRATRARFGGNRYCICLFFKGLRGAFGLHMCKRKLSPTPLTPPRACGKLVVGLQKPILLLSIASVGSLGLVCCRDLFVPCGCCALATVVFLRLWRQWRVVATVSPLAAVGSLATVEPLRLLVS